MGQGSDNFEDQVLAFETKKATVCEPDETLPMAGERWRHYKGSEYDVLAVANHTEQKGRLVIYVAAGKAGPVWARPLKQWNEKVGGVQRFRLVWGPR